MTVKIQDEEVVFDLFNVYKKSKGIITCFHKNAPNLHNMPNMDEGKREDT